MTAVIFLAGHAVLLCNWFNVIRFHVTVQTGEMQDCCCDLQMMTSPRLVEEGERRQCASAMLRLSW